MTGQEGIRSTGSMLSVQDSSQNRWWWVVKVQVTEQDPRLLALTVLLIQVFASRPDAFLLLLSVRGLCTSILQAQSRLDCGVLGVFKMNQCIRLGFFVPRQYFSGCCLCSAFQSLLSLTVAYLVLGGDIERFSKMDIPS